MNTGKITMNKIILAILVVTVASSMFTISSCTKDPKKPGLEFMPDMYRSSSFETYGENTIFKDKMDSRTPVKGTIPRDFTFFNYPNTPEGYEAASRDVHNPLPPTVENLAEGKRLYSIMCMHCHGESGQADGSLIATGKYPPPPSYSTGVSSRGGSMKDLTDGKIFHTITYGVNLMGSHASQLLPMERWKVIQYVHQLQNPAGSDSTATKAPADSTKGV